MSRVIIFLVIPKTSTIMTALLVFVIMATIVTWYYYIRHYKGETFMGNKKYDNHNIKAVNPQTLMSKTTPFDKYKVQAFGSVGSKRKVAREFDKIVAKVISITSNIDFFKHNLSLTPKHIAGLQLLKDMHGRNENMFNYVEIQPGTGFHGVNYPFGVQEHSKQPPIGKDKHLRAKRRIVFLTIRKSANVMQSDTFIRKLVIHELAHTIANHVLYRPDDHGQDFKDAEALLTVLWNSVPRT